MFVLAFTSTTFDFSTFTGTRGMVGVGFGVAVGVAVGCVVTVALSVVVCVVDGAAVSVVCVGAGSLVCIVELVAAVAVGVGVGVEVIVCEAVGIGAIITSRLKQYDHSCFVVTLISRAFPSPSPHTAPCPATRVPGISFAIAFALPRVRANKLIAIAFFMLSPYSLVLMRSSIERSSLGFAVAAH